MKRFIITLAVILGVVATVINWINPVKEVYVTYVAIAPLVAFGIAQAISGLGGMAIDAVARKRQMKQNEELAQIQQQNNFALMAKQNEYQKKMWQETNANAQVEEYKKAGLNVGLMYGGSGQGGMSVTGNTSGGAGFGQAGGEIRGMDINQAMQVAMLQSQLKVNESIANKNNAEANYTSGTQTQESQSRIGLLASQTENTQLKNVYQEYENQLNNIKLEVSSMTMEGLIRSMNASFEKAQQEAIQAMLKTGVDEATQQDKIEQMKNATQASYLDLVAKKLAIQLTQEQITKAQEEIKKIINDVDVSKQDIAIKNLMAQWQTQDVQLYKLWSEVFRNGSASIQQLGSLFKKGGSTVSNTYNNQKINSETIINE